MENYLIIIEKCKNNFSAYSPDISGVVATGKNREVRAILKKEKNELVSATNQLKLLASDGKRYNTDVFDSDSVVLLAKNFPNENAIKFLDWFMYSENTIDGKSKIKAYTLFDSSLLDTIKPGTIKGLQKIHEYLFGGLYDFVRYLA